MIERVEQLYADIPCYELIDKGQDACAEIILYHGWGSDAEKQCFRGHLLASFGYRVIVPEIPDHGVRGTLAYEDPGCAVDFLRVLGQSIEECQALSEAVFSQGKAHFLVGHSLGGMIALGAVMPLCDALSGVAAMNSSAEWGEPLAILRAVFFGEAAGATGFSSSAAQAQLKALDAYDPAHWAAQNIHTPVLLTNGALDETMPPSLNAGFCARGALPQVRRVVIPDAGHVVTDSALREVVQFIEAHR